MAAYEDHARPLSLTRSQVQAVLDALAGYDPWLCSRDHDHTTRDCEGWAPWEVADLRAAEHLLARSIAR